MKRHFPTPGYTFEIDLDLIARGLRVAPLRVGEVLRDGRVASRFTELWAEKIFRVTRHRHDHRSSDGFFEVSDGERLEIAVRTLTARGIRFQDSAFQGSGRTCTLRDLRASIRRSDRWYVFDIRFIPQITIYKVRCAVLEHWIDDNELTTTGLSAARFCELLNRDAQPQVRQLEFPKL